MLIILAAEGLLGESSFHSFLPFLLCMILGFELPPEFLGEMLGVIADALDVVKVFGRYLLQDFAHVSHCYLRIPVHDAVDIETLHEVPHHLAALSLARVGNRPMKLTSDVLHTDILHYLGVSRIFIFWDSAV